jgi:hypothetical protein
MRALDVLRDNKAGHYQEGELRTDAINGYGRITMRTVALHIDDQQCVLCGEWLSDMDILEEVDGQHRHRFRPRQRQIAMTTGRDLTEARAYAEALAANFLAKHPEAAR